MAEISEDAPETSKDASDFPEKKRSEITSAEICEPVPDFDPDTMRKTKPGLKRLILSLSVLFSFLFGLPFLLKSIEIYRAPLPFPDIDSLSNAVESTPLVFPCRFQAVFVGFDHKTSTDWSANKLGFSILARMRKFAGGDDDDDPVCGTCGNNYTVSVTVDSGTDCTCSKSSETACLWRCGAMNELKSGGKFKDDDEFVDEYLESALGGGEGGLVHGGKVYTVVVVKRDQEVRAVVGKHMHAWIVGRVSVVEAVEKIAEIFVRIFVNGGKEEGLIHGEFMPVGADGKVVLSFNLLNADPHDWIYDWYGALVYLSYLYGESGSANY